MESGAEVSGIEPRYEGGRRLALRAARRLFMAVFLLALAGFLASAEEREHERLLFFVGASAFALPFVLYGLVGGLRDTWTELRLRRALRLHPAEPWLGDHTWDPAGTGDVGNRLGYGVLAVALVVFAALMAAAVAWYRSASDEVEAGIALAAALLVWAAGFFPIRYGLRAVGRRVRHGRPWARFARFPFFLGEAVDVEVVRREGAPPLGELAVELRLMRHGEQQMPGGETHERLTVREVHWRHEARISAPDARAARLRVRVPLPPNVRALGTAWAAPKPRFWELELKSLEGPDFFARFVVPVYARAAQTSRSGSRR